MSYELKLNQGSTRHTTLEQMHIGDVGEIVGSGDYRGEIVLRTFRGVVSLTHPEHTWIPASGCDLRVRLLEHGETLTLTIL